MAHLISVGVGWGWVSDLKILKHKSGITRAFYTHFPLAWIELPVTGP